LKRKIAKIDAELKEEDEEKAKLMKKDDNKLEKPEEGD